MNRKNVFDYAEKYYGTKPDYPWGDNNAVLRHRVSHKWYGLLMEIGRNKLGLDGGTVEILNVKCDPVLIGSLLGREGFHPAYHMNKANWITIRLDGSVAMDEVGSLLDMSYGLTMPKAKRNADPELGNNPGL